MNTSLIAFDCNNNNNFYNFISSPIPGNNKMNNFAALNKAKMIDSCVRMQNTNMKLKFNIYELLNPPQLPEKIDLFAHLGYIVHVII